jgi:hypothetical protein
MNRGGQDARAPSEGTAFTSMSRTRCERLAVSYPILILPF